MNTRDAHVNGAKRGPLASSPGPSGPHFASTDVKDRTTERSLAMSETTIDLNDLDNEVEVIDLSDISSGGSSGASLSVLSQTLESAMMPVIKQVCGDGKTRVVTVPDAVATGATPKAAFKKARKNTYRVLFRNDILKEAMTYRMLPLDWTRGGRNLTETDAVELDNGNFEFRGWKVAIVPVDITQVPAKFRNADTDDDLDDDEFDLDDDE